MVLDDSKMFSLKRQIVDNSRHLSLSSFNCVLSNSYTEIQQTNQKFLNDLLKIIPIRQVVNHFRLILQLFLAYFLLRNATKFTNHENHCSERYSKLYFRYNIGSRRTELLVLWFFFRLQFLPAVSLQKKAAIRLKLP